MTILEGLNKVLRNTRLEKKISLASLSRRTGFSRYRLSRIESGEKGISMAFFTATIDALNEMGKASMIKEIAKSLKRSIMRNK